MNQHFDVVVLGAGVAGSCAALALARQGVRVALLEAGSLPRHKVCGEFLSSESASVFTRLGVHDAVHELAQPVSTARIVSPRGRSLVLPLPTSDDDNGAVAISRYRLDQALWQQAMAAGAEGHLNQRVKTVTRDTHHGFVVGGTAATWRARHVIAATGRGATLLRPSQARQTSTAVQYWPTGRYFGLKAHFRGVRLEPGVVELHPWSGGYCGLVRVEADVTNVCLLARYSLLQGPPRRSLPNFWGWLLSRCAPLSRRLAGAEQLMPWLTTGNVCFGEFAPTRDGMLCCGDAAGHIHPLTGDGMAMAARSGEMAAGAALKALQTGRSEAGYAATWRHEFKTRLRWARLLQPVLTTSSLAEVTLALLRRQPQLARRLVNLTRGN